MMAQTESLAGTTGRIITYTVIHIPTPEFAGEAPYGLAIIETQDGERMLARIPEIEGAQLAIGGTVVYDRDDERGPVFRLA